MDHARLSRRMLLISLLGASAAPRILRAQEGEPPPQHEEAWPLIGYRRVTASGRAVIHIDAGDGRVGEVCFQAQDRAVAVDRARFELVEGDPIEMRVGQALRAGETGAAIGLPPNVEVRIVRIDLRVMGGRGAATLNVLGRGTRRQVPLLHAVPLSH